MQRVLIIGATSAIAEATAREYAKRGAKLYLVGRDEKRLKAIADDLTVRGAPSCGMYLLDVIDLDRHGHMLDSAWEQLGGIDLALIAHGTLPSQRDCEASVEVSLHEFAVNGTSTIALATALAQRLQAPATLAVISSVAGDRGRASNYLYGSAKAAVSAFLSGLGQRLQGSGIHVVTIKPGFVDTPMTREFKKGALWAKPAAIARGIVRAIDRQRPVAYLPGFWWAIMTVIRSIPESIFRRIKL